MADGLILFWIVIGGSLTPDAAKEAGAEADCHSHWLAAPLRAALHQRWPLLEEVITTTMTNMAPVFGTTPEEAHITASTNYFVVVCFHSVVVFVPMFIAWALMLSWWKFTPLKAR